MNRIQIYTGTVFVMSIASEHCKEAAVYHHGSAAHGSGCHEGALEMESGSGSGTGIGRKMNFFLGFNRRASPAAFKIFLLWPASVDCGVNTVRMNRTAATQKKTMVRRMLNDKR